MIPSRGLRPAALSAQKSLLFQSSVKQFARPKKFSTVSSLATQGHLLTSQSRVILNSTKWRSNQLYKPTMITSISSVRYNSSSTVPPAPTSSVDALSSLTNISTTNVSAIPERIGYLHDLGLNYGWGPTSMLEWTLEHIHIYSGMPWWGSVVTTAVLIRVACLPLYMKMTEVAARQLAMAPLLKPLQAKQQLAVKNKDQELMAIVLAEMREIYRDSGIKLKYLFFGPVIQGVLGFCTFKLTRAMANLPVPGLETGGFLWISDLTVADPYFLLPLTTAALMHIVGRRGGESGVQQLTSGQRKVFLYFMPVMAAFFTSWLPAITQLSFVTASIFSTAQSMAFRNAALRRSLGLTPLYHNSAVSSSGATLGGSFSKITSTSGHGSTMSASSSGIIDTTATVKRQSTKSASSSGFINMENFPSSKRTATANANRQGVSSSSFTASASGSGNVEAAADITPRSNLQRIANAPFKGIVDGWRSGKKWVDGQVFRATGNDVAGNKRQENSSQKRKGSLARRG